MPHKKVPASKKRKRPDPKRSRAAKKAAQKHKSKRKLASKKYHRSAQGKANMRSLARFNSRHEALVLNGTSYLQEAALHAYDIRSVVCVVLNPEGSILMGLSTHEDARRGYLCFPGGGVEAGESLLEAGIRGVREETGEHVQPLLRQALVLPGVPGLAFLLMRTNPLVHRDPEIQDNEFQEIIWVPLSLTTEQHEIYPPNHDLLHDLAALMDFGVPSDMVNILHPSY